MGVLLAGLATGSATGIAGASYHLIDHAIFKALLFLCAGSIVHMTGVTKLSEMGGLARHYRLPTGAFVVGVLSISGVPPFNGYVSLGLIHDALRSSHQFMPFAAMLIAQVITMAALGRAAWQAFFAHPSGDEAPHNEDLRPGMVVSLSVLALGCLAFGIFPRVVLSNVAAQAASALLHPASYAHAVLASGGSIPRTTVHLDYWDPVDLATVAGTIILAIPCALVALRYKDRAIGVARRIQNGSVNDYASYLVSGTILTVIVLAR
jgi:multicomponent Na+:H+ antiporter subunit D